MAIKIFIDGEAGTTGLSIREKLDGQNDFELLTIDENKRKSKIERKNALNAADIAILCLPDEAAKEAVEMVVNDNTRIIDASTAHRTTHGWIYGFPEYQAGQEKLIGNAARVTNPGCYAVASIAILKPLIDFGILPRDWPISINGVSGYSGGGKQLISAFENDENGELHDTNFFNYGLLLDHKHVPEITYWSGLKNKPIFSPSVGRFRQGMIVQVPIFCWALPGQPSSEFIQNIYEEFYINCDFVRIEPRFESSKLLRLNPEGLNDTNELRIYIFNNDKTGQVLIVSVLDNLGKGASGQALQNLYTMVR